MATRPPQDEPADESIDAWIRALHGERSPTGGDQPSEWEARALRAHLVAEAQQHADEGRGEAEMRLQSLLFALRHHGLLDRPRKPRFYVPLALAASLLIGVLIVRPLLESPAAYDEPPSLRGETSEVRVEAADPKARAEVIAKSLGAHGLTPHIFQSGRTFFVDVDVPPDAPEPAVRDLRGLGVGTTQGFVRLRIEPR
jgi:hypothetical protein